jgi:hypothetical protein
MSLPILSSPTKVVEMAKTAIFLSRVESPSSSEVGNNLSSNLEAVRTGETLPNLLKIANDTKVPTLIKNYDSAEDALRKIQVFKNHKGNLNFETASARDIKSIVYGLIQFLFLPFFLFSNGSFFLDIQSLELPFWLITYFGIYHFLVRKFFKNKDFPPLLQPLAIFCSIFLVSSTFFETNMGTAVRHRSILIMVFLTALFFFKEKTTLQEKI